MTPSSDRDPVDLLAEEFAQRCRRGERPSVAAFVAQYPEHAAELADVLPAVAQMELLKTYRQNPATDAIPSLAIDATPVRLGDYRIVRELGRGGMGIVYEAVQESLGRRVALKTLPEKARQDAGKRERFLREAQAAARLHHTNIVPVFGVGEADGIPYFVMQYIRGCGLNDVLNSWPKSTYSGSATSVTDTPVSAITQPMPRSATLLAPNDWPTICRIIADVADALHYAHENGTLHRDMKPGNLLLDLHGQVWVADFGLAKQIDQKSLTATGDILGTVQYMAPEQLHGETTRQSDIYSLGMTLYELCTKMLPFDDSNPALIIRQIADREPPTPRSLNAKIPSDLETIILCAIAREPRGRYATAAEFAADLRAFVSGAPIRARRLSAVSRLWRVCKRNPLVSGLIATTTIALACAAIFGWSAYIRVSNDLETERLRSIAEAKLRAEADDANQKLAENLNLSLEAMENVFKAASENDGPTGLPFQFMGDRGPPGDRGDRGPPGERGGGLADRAPGERYPRPPSIEASQSAAMLEVILKFYDRFAERNATEPALRFQAAKAARRIADLQVRMGRPEKADPAARRSLAMMQPLVQESPNAAELQREVILASSRVQPVPPEHPDFQATLQLFTHAAQLAEQLRTTSAELPPMGGPMADLYWKLGQMYRSIGNTTQADANMKRSEQIHRNRPMPFGRRPDDRPPP